MTSRMSVAEYRAHMAKNSVSSSGRVVPVTVKPRDPALLRQFSDAASILTRPPKPKYGNKKVQVDGITFDSKREAGHWNMLKLRVAAGQITDLQRQVKFELHVNGIKVCTYVADFTYHEAGALVIADSKGMKTPMYRLKKKMVKTEYGLDIVEL